jgi:hypothetical protein
MVSTRFGGNWIAAEPLGTRDVVKFGVLVGATAIFIDAAIAHGIFWENDPYWTYWITKTFLITTIFAFGTAFLGIGIWPGILLTAVHTLVLEVYYEVFAPIGLPQEPQWLAFRDLWTVGLVTHYLAIFAGYLIALWIWRRSRNRVVADTGPRAGALFALGAAVLVVVFDGAITQGLLLQDFPGWTFFLQHLLIAFVFLFVWDAWVGFAADGWIAASVLLAMLWTTYGMYLGPVGLPDDPPQYLGYRDLWLRSFPGGVVAALVGLWLATRFLQPWVARALGGALVCLIVAGLAAPGQILAAEGEEGSAAASGDGTMVVGPNPYDLASTIPMNGSITVSVVDVGNRWSALQNVDEMNVVADFTAEGARYQVTIDRAMPRHPLGAYTTWFGVVYDAAMHGDTDIGTSALPRVTPEIALWGWAEVTKDGALIAKSAPAHVMVMRGGPMPGIALEVATEDTSLVGAPDGYLTVLWPQVASLSVADSEQRTHELLGWAVLLAVVVAFGWLAIREPSMPGSIPSA